METLKKDKKKTSLEMVALTHKYNVKHELPLGRKLFLFRGRETKIIPKALLKGPDWNQEKERFLVKEVKHAS
jgi:hypothetical protein